jgi:tetratricopeptide (TPR) repeat protein
VGNRAHAEQLHASAREAMADPNRSQALVDHAFASCCSACFADPTWWNAFYHQGNHEGDRGCHPAAIAHYRQALACDIPDARDRAKVLCNLGWRLHQVGQTEEAYDASRQAIEIDPELVYAWVNLSQICGTLGRPAEGVAAGQRAFALSPAEPTVELALAFALLFNHSFAAGLKHFEVRFYQELRQYYHYHYPRWQGEKGMSVFLVADQGLGDTLSFARFVPAACARAGHVHAFVQGELMRAFQYAFRKIPNLTLSPSPSPFPPADAWTTFVSLPFALGLTDEQIRNAPNIEVASNLMRRSHTPPGWMVPDRKLHVGIAWAGSPKNLIDKHRNIPVEFFFELLRVPDVALYSLQVDSKKAMLHEAGGAGLVRDLSGYVRDVCDTWGLLRDLDLVITCESALGHIAAAVNHECWVPYSYLGRDHRIGLDGTDRLWTSQHKIIPQGPSMRWDRAFESIVELLRERAK